MNNLLSKRNKKTCFNVSKELSKQWICEIIDNFFEIRTHEKTTRNKGFLLRLPRYVFSVLNLVFFQWVWSFIPVYLLNSVKLNVLGIVINVSKCFYIFSLYNFIFIFYRFHRFSCKTRTNSSVPNTEVYVGLKKDFLTIIIITIIIIIKVFLDISPNSQENISARVSFLIKLLKKENLFSWSFKNI